MTCRSIMEDWKNRESAIFAVAANDDVRSGMLEGDRDDLRRWEEVEMEI